MTIVSISPRRNVRACAAIAIGVTIAAALAMPLGIEQCYASDLQASTPIAVKTKAAAKGSKYALLAKDGYLYPCNSKGKKLAKAWDAYSSKEPYRITKLFVAANAKKVPDRVRYREYYKYSRKTGVYSYYLSSLSKMKNVTFLLKKGKNSCKSIADNAFSYRSSLKTLTNFNKTKVTAIGKSAFYLSGLTKVAFPSTLKTIEQYAFYGCKSLKTVSGLDKTKISNMGDHAFYQCSMKGIALPGSLKSIGADAFYGCRSLTAVTLPASVNTLGFGAFSDCINLSSFTMKSPTMVISADSASGSMHYMLLDTPIANASAAAYIYVPKSLLASYQATSYTNPWHALSAKFRAIA